MTKTFLVDGHVHFHPCFGVRDFLEAAVTNFDAARLEVGRPEAVGCLMFTENAWRHDFTAFADGLVTRSAPEWAVTATSEDFSLLARRKDGATLIFVAGRQLVTEERLEILALGTRHRYSDGLPMAEAVESVATTDALTVLPWGFGKWTGRRGRLVKELLASPRGRHLFVGDNGGRAAVGPNPPLFGLARERGIPILPGSDPLPLPAEVRKPGRFGFVLEGEIDQHAPASSIKRLLLERIQPRRFGRLEGLATFAHRQVALRLRKPTTDGEH